MDIELAKTFIAVYETGSFNRAAERLNVTQSTISTRIASLEEQIGRSVFARSRAGTSATDAGKKFYPHASGLVNGWIRAMHELRLPEGVHHILRLGGQYSLWDELMSAWFTEITQTNQNLAVQVSMSTPVALTRSLQEGSLDVGLMYMPQNHMGLSIEKVFEDELILVSSNKESIGTEDENYIEIDWGHEFEREFQMTFPNHTKGRFALSHGKLAMNHIMEVGGTCWLPKRFLRSDFYGSPLSELKGFPVFKRPIYAVQNNRSQNRETIDQAMNVLKRVVEKVKDHI